MTFANVEMDSINFVEVLSDMKSMSQEVIETLVKAVKAGPDISSVDADLTTQSCMQGIALLDMIRKLLNVQAAIFMSREVDESSYDNDGDGSLRTIAAVNTMVSLDILQLRAQATQTSTQSPVSPRSVTYSGNSPLISLFSELSTVLDLTLSPMSTTSSLTASMQPATLSKKSNGMLTVRDSLTDSRSVKSLSKAASRVLRSALCFASSGARLVAAVGTVILFTVLAGVQDFYLSVNGGFLTSSLLSLLLDYQTYISAISSATLRPDLDHSILLDQPIVTVDILSALLPLGASRPQNLALAVLRRGCIDWVVKSLVPDVSTKPSSQTSGPTSHTSGPTSLSDAGVQLLPLLSLALLRLLSQSEDVRRSMLTSTKVQAEDLDVMLGQLLTRLCGHSLYAGSVRAGNWSAEALTGLQGVLSAETLWWLCREKDIRDHLSASQGFPPQLWEAVREAVRGCDVTISAAAVPGAGATGISGEVLHAVEAVLIAHRLMTADTMPSLELVVHTVEATLSHVGDTQLFVEFSAHNKSDVGLPLLHRYVRSKTNLEKYPTGDTEF